MALSLETTLFYLLAYNLAIVLTGLLTTRFTRNVAIIFGMQFFMMALLTPLLAYMIAGG